MSSLKCYVCDSTSAGEKCGQYPELTAGDTKYIADCHRNSVCKKSEIDDDGDICRYYIWEAKVNKFKYIFYYHYMFHDDNNNKFLILRYILTSFAGS